MQSLPEQVIFGDLDVAQFKLGDVNLDGHVDAADISAMEAILANPTEYESQHAITAAFLLTITDINQDGEFNNADLEALVTALKNGSGSADPVPEPTTITLLAIGTIGFVFSRRRFAG